uniref:RNase H type-1 domain-containing protein n=1 Tax=Cannabis sativa TaxID=3483 RepID=A0A803NW84_CANSA
MFNQHDSDLILSIQLSSSSGIDCWYWSKETSGIYSIRSAYKLLEFVNGNWPSTGGMNHWKQIWNLNVPAKVQHLLWRVIPGCLPTKLQLSIKHVPVDLTCPMCNLEPETVSHVLFRYNFARSCWNLASADTAGADDIEFSSWFCDLLLHCRKAVVEEAAMIIWQSWTAQNDLLWNNKSTTASEVIRSAKTNLDNWQNAQLNGSIPLLNVNLSNGREHWTKLVSTKFKINVDGAIFAAENRFGIGFLLRDTNGKLIEVFSSSKFGVVSPEIAEIMGVKEALSWIKTKALTEVEIETDSLVVVQAINGSGQMPSQFGLLVQDCRLLLSELHKVFLSFVKRYANRAAHCIARQSYFTPDRIFDEASATSDLLSIVREDCFSS